MIKTFLFFLLVSVPAFSKVVVLEIGKDNSPIYSKPSFDASVRIRLDKGRKLYGVDRPVEGSDGFGLFHKVRLKKGVYGYVLDTDLKGFEPDGIFAKGATSSRLGQKRSRRRGQWDLKSMTRSRSYGLSYSYINYAIKTISSTEKAGSHFFGVKLTGPWLNQGLPLDVNFSFSPSSPSFFDELTTEHSGFMAFLDANLLFDFAKGSHWQAYWGIGGMLSYYSFELQFNGTNELRDSSQTDFGFSGLIGAGYQWERYLFKMEGKYMTTNENHLGLMLSVQRYF